MAKDYRYRYSVSMKTVTGYNTPAGWDIRPRAGRALPKVLCGKPTDAKLAIWVADYNASLLPGGCNSHIHILGGRCLSASIFDHDTDSVVANWAAS